MEIPHTALPRDVLRGIIEEFVLQEGTDYGAEEHSLDAKVEQVLQQLERRKALLIFDEQSETCHIVRA